MNLKSSIAIALTIAAAFASFGCGDSGKQSGSSSSASVSTQQKKPLDEATIRGLAKKMASSKIEDRKEACPLEKLPYYSWTNTSLQKSNIDLNQPAKCDNLSISDIKQEGDFASAQVSFTGMDNKPQSGKWYFKRLNGKWCINGSIKTMKSLQVSGFDSSRLEAAVNLGYTYQNEPVLLLDVRSKTSVSYQVGGWSQPSYILVTDKGEFSLQNTTDFAVDPLAILFVTSAQPSRFILPFKGAAGTPKSLRITGFNELDSQGFPVDHDYNQVVTFTLNE